MPFFGIIPSLWSGNHRGHLTHCSLFGHIPFIKQSTQLLDPLWILCGQVVFFGRIFFEIEKLGFPVFRCILHPPGCSVIGEKKLVVSFDYPTVKKGSLWVFYVSNVMGKGLPKESVSLDFPTAFELRKQIEPGEVMRPLGASCCKYRRNEIEGRAKFRPVSRWNGSFPTEHNWVSGATFIGTAFGAGTIPTLLGLNPAVIRYINDQSVLSDTCLIDMIHQGTTSLVEPFAHGIVLGDPFLHSLGQILFVETFGRVVRSMGKEGSVPDEERFLLLDRLIDEIKDRFHSFPSNFKSVVTMSAPGVRITTGHAFRESSALVRSFPPFSALMTHISLFSEPMRKASMFVDIRNNQFLWVLARSLRMS